MDQHPPAHSGWKRIVLNGGPADGQELTLKGTRNMVVLGVHDDGTVNMQSAEKGAVYVNYEICSRPDGMERFDFLGHRSTEEIHNMLRGGMMSGGDPDDCGDADWWKK
jgi:hypothetical protein